MKLIATILTSVLALSGYCLMLYAAEPPMWTFDGKDAKKELSSWINLNQLAPLEIKKVKDKKGEERGVLVTKSLGGDPYMFPGGGWNIANYEPFDGTKYNVIYMAIFRNESVIKPRATTTIGIQKGIKPITLK
jgi:hypothetical protein